MSEISPNFPFLSAGKSSQADYLAAISQAAHAVCEHYASIDKAYDGLAPQALREQLLREPICPEEGAPLDSLIAWAGEHVLANSIALGSTRTMAHLHCAPMIPALAAEVMISASNASMDSWDQAPAATVLEQQLLAWLGELIGWGNNHGGGTLTSGGTQSNLMGLLLARDAWCARDFGVRVQQDGLPELAQTGRIFCAKSAHFSVQQAAALLGLGHQAVIAVDTDADQRLCPEHLKQAILSARKDGARPFAVVATAGTTDYGSIDPLPVLADMAAQEQLWLHVDAAYAGALLLSDALQSKLTGLARADSVTLDFHKMFYQPISASAFMLRDGKHWDWLRLHADYLNPPEHEALGMDDLVTRSIQTTRRFDALKIVLSLRHLGRKNFARLIEQTLDNAQTAADILKNYPDLELMTPPRLNTVLFRFAGKNCPPEKLDQLNHRIRQRLFLSGFALLGQTRFAGKIVMKMTLLNPNIGAQDFAAIFEQVMQLAQNEALD